MPSYSPVLPLLNFHVLTAFSFCFIWPFPALELKWMGPMGRLGRKSLCGVICRASFCDANRYKARGRVGMKRFVVRMKRYVNE